MTIQLSKTEEARILRDRRAQERREIAKARRVKSPKADRGRERDNGFLQFVRRQPCAARGLGNCFGAVEATHIRMASAAHNKPLTGLGVKPSDRWCLPACRGHHLDQHMEGDERRWWSKVGIDPFETAKRLYAEYRGLNGVVSRRDGADKGGG